MSLFRQQIRLFSTGLRLGIPIQTENKVTPIQDSVKKLKITPVIGLEVHAQLNIQSKLFSRGSNNSLIGPNLQLDLLDIATPGSLPILNERALRAAILTALGLNCTIQDVIHFDRKNYFYTDMPAGYQITQYNKPIAKNGYIDFIVTTHHKSWVAHSQQYDITKYLYHEDRMSESELRPCIKRSQIKQIQLEQDSAKTLCYQTGSLNEPGDELNNLVDYNRSGTGLIEIVFEPDLENPHEAASLVKELIKILKTLNTCDCELQEGSLRVDANVSIGSINDQKVAAEDGNRVELKNLNSLKSLTKGLSYEIDRQAQTLLAGDRVHQESRTFDTRSGKTWVLRAKESAIDYRYVPEPSIPPLRIEQESHFLNEAKSQLDQLTMPVELRTILTERYKLDLILTAELIDEPGLAEYSLDIMEDLRDEYNPNEVADFLIYSEANLKDAATDLVTSSTNDLLLKRLGVDKFRQLFDMIQREELSYACAYEVMKVSVLSNNNQDVIQIVEQKRWFQVRDEQEIEKLCSELIVGMKNVSKKYKKKGEKRHLQMLLDKLCSLYDNRISIKQAIKCLNKLLRSDGGGGGNLKGSE